MIVSGAVPPIIVLANSGSFETKTQCMSILQRMLLGESMPDEVSQQTALALRYHTLASHAPSPKLVEMNN